MKLFTKSIDQKLFAQYNMGNNMNQMAVAKIFNPYGRGYWFILNSDPNDPDYLWAIVDFGYGAEVGSVSRKELERMRVKPFMLPLERDLGYTPRPAKEVIEGLKQGKYFKEGGEVKGEENKEMLENQAHSIEHHSKELNQAVKRTKSVEPWVITKTQRASTDLADVTHYLEGESKYASGGKLTTNRMMGEESDDYGTFEIYKRGGQIDVKIVNEGQKFGEEKYNWLMGDFDSDGVSNADDLNPIDKKVSGKVDSPSLSSAMDYLINLKGTMDENMYSFVNDLKSVAPNNSKIYARTKTPYSILNKLVTKRLLNPKTGLTDLIGTTIVTTNKAELDKVKDAISSGSMGKVIEFEDMYKTPKQGYRAYHFLVERGGMPVEVQLKTKRQKAINELSHEPYKLKRLNAQKLLDISSIADKADKGEKAAIRQYNEFMNQSDIDNVFFLAKGGMLDEVKKGDEGMYQGGEVRVIMVDHNSVIYQYLDKEGNRIGSVKRANKNDFQKLFAKFPTDDMEKGGLIDEQNLKIKLIGHYYQIIPEGMKTSGDEYADKIVDVNIDSDKYRYRNVRIQGERGNAEELIPLTEINDFLSGKELLKKDNKGYYAIKLLRNKKKGMMAKGGVTDEDYKKRIKKFGFKPFGKTKGKFSVVYFENGEKQQEVWETREMALSNAKRYKKIPNYSKISVTDSDGNDITSEINKLASGGMMAKGGEISKRKDGNLYVEYEGNKYIVAYSSDGYDNPYGIVFEDEDIITSIKSQKAKKVWNKLKPIIDVWKKNKLASGGMMAKDGATFAEKVSAIKSKLKGTKVPSKLQKDYGKKYSSKEAEMAAKRIAGAMRKKEL